MNELKNKAEVTKHLSRRIVALLNKDQIEYINRLSVDSYFSAGSRLTKVDIIAALVDAAMQLGITGTNVKSRQDLITKILQAVADTGNGNIETFKKIPEEDK